MNLKKLFSFLVFAASACFAADSVTDRIGLTKPEVGSTGWAQKVNADFTIIDSSVAVLTQPNTFTSANAFISDVSITYLNPNQCVTTDGNRKLISQACITPPGADSQVIFNQGGTISADPSMSWDVPTKQAHFGDVYAGNSSTFTVVGSSTAKSLMLTANQIAQIDISSNGVTYIRWSDGTISTSSVKSVSAGSGVSVYPATSTIQANYGVSATTITVSTITLNGSIIDGIGNEMFRYTNGSTFLTADQVIVNDGLSIYNAQPLDLMNTDESAAGVLYNPGGHNESQIVALVNDGMGINANPAYGMDLTVPNIQATTTTITEALVFADGTLLRSTATIASGTETGGGGIVSPGSFTWTNNYGLSVSTVVAGGKAGAATGYSITATGFYPLQLGNNTDMPTTDDTKIRFFEYGNITDGYFGYRHFSSVGTRVPGGLAYYNAQGNPFVMFPTKDNSDFRYGYKGVMLLSTGTLTFRDTSAGYVAFHSSPTVAGNILWTLPDRDATGCWQSDGAGNLSIGSCGSAPDLTSYAIRSEVSASTAAIATSTASLRTDVDARAVRSEVSASTAAIATSTTTLQTNIDGKMASFVWPTCSGSDKLTSAGTTPTCAADQTGAVGDNLGAGTGSYGISTSSATFAPTGTQRALTVTPAGNIDVAIDATAAGTGAGAMFDLSASTSNGVVIYNNAVRDVNGAAAFLTLISTNTNDHGFMFRIMRNTNDSAPYIREDGPAPNDEIIATSTDNAHGLGKWEPHSIANQGVNLQVNSRAWDNSTFETVAQWVPLSKTGSGLTFSAQSLANDSGVFSSSDTALVNFTGQNGRTVGITGPLNPTVGSYSFGLPSTPNNQYGLLYQANNGRSNNNNTRQWEMSQGDFQYNPASGVSISTATVTKQFFPPSGTLTALQALTTTAGQLAYCSDCTTDAVCVSTGTKNSFVRASARTTKCQ